MPLSSKNFEHLLSKLKALGQDHLLKELPSAQLLLEIEALDPNLFQNLQKLIHQQPSNELSLTPPDPFIPVEKLSSSLKFMNEGKVGCLIVAGGQGTRLGFKGAKGLFPIGSKTLYQILAERVLMTTQKARHFLPIAIMTSPQNREETEGYFRCKDFFGLLPEQVEFFTQTEIPFLDDEGNLFLDPQGEIAQGPDGNGWALKSFFKSGIWEKWRMQGIEALNFILIDNLLADPFDPQLINFHFEQKNDISVKAIPRENPMENVGIFAKGDGVLQVVEYTEFPLKKRTLLLPNGELAYPYANLSLFCFRMDAIPTWDYDLMPWHLARKPAKRQDLTSPPAWKFEKFIFDLLPFTRKVGGVLYPRKQAFAPFKSLDDLPNVLVALQTLNLDVNLK